MEWHGYTRSKLLIIYTEIFVSKTATLNVIWWCCFSTCYLLLFFFKKHFSYLDGIGETVYPPGSCGSVFFIGNWEMLISGLKDLQEEQRKPSEYSLCARNFLISLHVFQFKPHWTTTLSWGRQQNCHTSQKLSGRTIILTTEALFFLLELATYMPKLWIHSHGWTCIFLESWG